MSSVIMSSTLVLAKPEVRIRKCVIGPTLKCRHGHIVGVETLEWSNGYFHCPLCHTIHMSFYSKTRRIECGKGQDN